MSDQIVSYILQNALPSTLIQVYFRVSSKLFKQFVHSWTIIEWPAPHAHISRSEQMLKCWNPDNAPKNARVFAHLKKTFRSKTLRSIKLGLGMCYNSKTRRELIHLMPMSARKTQQNRKCIFNTVLLFVQCFFVFCHQLHAIFVRKFIFSSAFAVFLRSALRILHRVFLIFGAN